jgi:hypothetical protein
MTSIVSLFQCAAQDVTIERVRELVAQAQPESLTLEYKEGFTPNIVKSIAAMANTYGGLILVGATDQRQIVGVPEDTIIKITSACYEKLEPPWEPEIIPVRMAPSSDLFVHVVRVDPAHAPRPVLVDGAAPIRLHGRVAKADRGRLAQLFAESHFPNIETPWTVQRPQIPSNVDGSRTTDFILRSGLSLPLDPKMIWRPLSDRAVDALAGVLNASPLNGVLLRWLGDFGVDGLNPFHRVGFNRARDARLAWQAATDSDAHRLVEAVAKISVPGAYGDSSSQLVFTLDIEFRTRAYIAARASFPGEVAWRLSVSRLYELCDTLAATLVDPSVRQRLADIAGVDPVIVPQPTNLHFVCGDSVSDLLYLNGLTVIEDAGASHGAHLLADPAHDLSELSERRLQIDSWLEQIALDAGLRGMERVLADHHRQG